MKKKWTKEEERYFSNLVSQGKDNRQIARLFDITPAMVQYKKRGLHKRRKAITRGQIYYIEPYGKAAGSEQQAGRPAVVVSNDRCNRHSSVIEVVYLTASRKAPLPTHVFISGIQRESIALCEQVFSIAKMRVGDYIGEVTPKEQKQIDKALMVSLGIREETNDSKDV